MADRNGTLTADTAISVVVDSDDLRVLNRDGADEIWVSVDGGEDPTVGDQDPRVHCIPAVAGAAIEFKAASPRQRIVRLISAGTPAYSVQPL